MQSILLTYVPDILIIVLYLIMIVVIVWKDIQCKKKLLTAGLISLTSVLTTLPSILLYYDVVTFDGKYMEGIIFVSVIFLGCFLDPIIYFASNKRMRARCRRRLCGAPKKRSKGKLRLKATGKFITY